MRTIQDHKRLDEIREQFKYLGLSVSLIERVYEENNGHNYLPYHGFQHLITVSLRSIEGGLSLGLSLHEIKALAVAGLTHDTMYVPNRHDSLNISDSKSFLRALNVGEISDLSERYIEATEFPHNNPRSLGEKVIQDADLMQCLEEDCDRFVAGLEEEWLNVKKADPNFPGLDSFNTEWAKTIYTKEMSERGKKNV